MTERWVICAGWFVLMLFAGTLQAEPIPISRVSGSAIGDYAEIFFEPGERMPIEEARSLFADNAGISGERDILNFGIGAPAHWLKFIVNNPTKMTITKMLSVETAWLDDLAIYIFKKDELQAKYVLGDSLVQTARPIDNRFYVIEYEFQPGTTSLYLRVASNDAMLLPIYLDDGATFNKRFEFKNYSYGLLYGVLAALLLYNLMLFFSLHSAPHFFYSLFLTSLIACNLAYTGHGFRWLWPHAIHWQQWANPVLMTVTGICGLLFAFSFLETRKTLPKLYWAVSGLCLAVLIGLGAAYYAAQIQTALILALVFIVLCTVLMALLGIFAYRAENPSANYFLLASILGAISAIITALTVSDMLPYSIWGYRAVEIGMVVEAILLALALADNFRRGEKKRLQAAQ
ncbi:MAG TPA: 7TM diverse intracellular signaling domain-containing protein [Methylophaga sp.]|nr:7TM diverse intracellular signaling domain-containing protein [Methylophaga sp.]